jgi:hypothetical protein
MSLPAALAGQQLSGIAALSPIEGLLQIFNNNPYFIGLMMLILNLGGRFISLEVTKKQEQFLQLPWVRRILIFTVLFVATRNIWVAFWSTLTFVLFLGYLFNENSALCLFGEGGKSGSTCADGINAPKPGEEMTPEEKEILHRLSAKAQRYQTAEETSKNVNRPDQDALDKSLRYIPSNKENVLHTDIYSANLSLLRN